MFRVETIPLIAGGIVTLMGLAILADAWIPEELNYKSERRRQARQERSAAGEACVGIGVLCMAAALIGRDTWPYSTVAMIAATLLFIVGAWLNWSYLRERFTHRGDLRRGKPTPPRTPPSTKG